MKKLYNEKQYLAIEYLSKGVYTYKEVAELVGTSVDSLREWRREPDFQDEVRARCREILKEHEPFLYNAAFQEIKKNGSYQHIKLMLERMGRLEDIAEGGIRNYDVMFTWKQQEPTVDDS